MVKYKRDMGIPEIPIPNKWGKALVMIDEEVYEVRCTFPLDVFARKNGATVEFIRDDCPDNVWFKLKGRAFVKWENISGGNFQMPKIYRSKHDDINWNVARERWEAISSKGLRAHRLGDRSLGYYATQEMASKSLNSYNLNPQRWKRENFQDENTIME